jgi:hypothetical protein
MKVCVLCDGVSSFLPPPLLFKAVTRGFSAGKIGGRRQNQLLDVTGKRHMEAGARGPSGSSAELVVQPTPSDRLWLGDWYVGPYIGSGRLGAILYRLHAWWAL